MATKPLTAEEIAELRNALPIVVPSAAEVSVTMDAAHWMGVVCLLDEVERSRALLTAVARLARSAATSGDFAKAMEVCFEIERRVAALIG